LHNVTVVLSAVINCHVIVYCLVCNHRVIRLASVITNVKWIKTELLKCVVDISKMQYIAAKNLTGHIA